MKLKDRYDCVVLGDHPGAILCGLMASRLGLTALLIPHCGSHGLFYSQDRRAVIDPESSFLLGLGRAGTHAGLWHEILRKMESPALQPLLELSQGSFGGWLDQHYFRVNPWLEGWSHECEWNGLGKNSVLHGLDELLKKHSELFVSFWDKYPASLRTQEKRSRFRFPLLARGTHDIRSKLFDQEETGKQSTLLTSKKTLNLKVDRLDRESKRLAEFLWSGWVEDRAPIRDLFDLLHLLSVGQLGAMIPGGAFELRTLLMKAAQESGVHILDRTISLDVRAHQEGVSHLFLGEEKKQVDMGCLVLGCSSDQLKNLAQKKIDFEGLCRPAGWIFTMMLRLSNFEWNHEEPSRFVIQETGSPRLFLETKKASDYSLEGDPQDQLIFIRTLLPFSEESILPEFQRMVAQRMLNACFSYFPRFSSYPHSIFPSLEKNEKEGFSKVFGFPSLEYIPENLRVYSEMGYGPEFGVRGAFVVSGESYPQLGSLGPAVAAVEAVHWLATQSGVAGVFG